MRLLIVEDNEELAELLAKGLLTAGYEADILSRIDWKKADITVSRSARLDTARRSVKVAWVIFAELPSLKVTVGNGRSAFEMIP